MYHLERSSFIFCLKKKKSYFREKRNNIFPDITKKIIFKCDFFGKTIFSEHLKKTSYYIYFLRKIIFLFPPKQ